MVHSFISYSIYWVTLVNSYIGFRCPMVQHIICTLHSVSAAPGQASFHRHSPPFTLSPPLAGHPQQCINSLNGALLLGDPNVHFPGVRCSGHLFYASCAFVHFLLSVARSSFWQCFHWVVLPFCYVCRSFLPIL